MRKIGPDLRRIRHPLGPAAERNRQAVAVDEIDGLADRRQHAERQQVDLQHSERLDVVLVPFEDRAVLHRSALDRHDLHQRGTGDHEPPDMLGAVPRESEDLADKLDHRAHAGGGWIKSCGAHAFGGRLGKRSIEARLERTLGDIVARAKAAAAPAVDLAGEAVHGVRREPERLADIAHGAAPPVADDLADERGAIAAVLRVDVLDDLLAPLVLEVDVDVGRLVALTAHEALEEDIDAVGVDRRDAERVADGAVRGGAASLAKDAARSREGDDVMDGQEVRRVAEVVDDGELVLKLARDLGGHAARVALARALPYQVAEVLHRRHALRHDLVGIFVAQLVE